MSGLELEKIATKKKKATVRKTKAQKKLVWFSVLKKVGKTRGFNGYGQESKEILHNSVHNLVHDVTKFCTRMKDTPGAIINFRRALCGTQAHAVAKLGCETADQEQVEFEKIYDEFKPKYEKIVPPK